MPNKTIPGRETRRTPAVRPQSAGAKGERMRNRDVFDDTMHTGNGNGTSELNEEGRFDRVRERAMSGMRTVDTKVRGLAGDHPVVTLLMALGLGYGLGYLIYRRARATGEE